MPMNRHVNAISGRLSLRQPQRDSLEILDRICEILPPKPDSNRDTALATIQSEYPTVTDFEREFPSLCFSLATGVGKTRLMGAFITYLHLAHGIKNLSEYIGESYFDYLANLDDLVIPIQDRDRFHNDFLIAENILGRDFSVQTLLLIGSTVSLAEHLMH
jgi:Type III restriction enzyme, res subunit